MSGGRRGAALLALVALLLPAAAAGARADSDAAEVASASRDTTAAAILIVAVTANGSPAGTAPGPGIDAGAAVAWAYEVTNAGTAGLWALYVWHDGVGAADCPDRSLAGGETVHCTAASTAGSGSIASAVHAWAWDDAGTALAAEAAAYYTGSGPTAPPAPAIDLEAYVAGKDADAPPGPVLEPGRPATFRYVVTNSGNVTLRALRVRDPVRGTIACPTRNFAPGEQVVCVVRWAAAAGAQAATAEARASDAAGTEVVDQDPIHYFGAARVPGVEIEALVEGFDGDTAPGPRVGAPGETIAFTYVVTNTGGLPLSRIRVRDSARGAVACPGRALAPGASMTCAASTVAQLGGFASVGRVTAWTGTGVVRDSDPIHYHVRSEPRIHHLDLEVTVNGREADEVAAGPNLPVGGQAYFVYLITYTGNNIVYNVTIQDPFVPESAVFCYGVRTLSTGQTLRCTATVSAGAGQYSSLVTVVSWDADGRRVTAEDWVHYYGMP